jgi:hypothetical protein
MPLFIEAVCAFDDVHESVAVPPPAGKESGVTENVPVGRATAVVNDEGDPNPLHPSVPFARTRRQNFVPFERPLSCFDVSASVESFTTNVANSESAASWR